MKISFSDIQQQRRERVAALPHAKALSAFLLSPAGDAVRKELLKEFVWGKLVGEDQLETYFNLGARSVAVWLLELDVNERTGE